MKEYYLELAGLKTLLRTPEEIAVGERLQPFLERAFDCADCTLTVQIVSALPEFAPGGTWHGVQYYDTYGNTKRVFHCSAPGAAAFALTEMEENGDAAIRVLEGYESWFAGTSGIFNRLNMETMLLQHKGLMLHASLIKYEGKAIGFTGPSGVGKSTQAELWRHCLGAEVLNGDRAALRLTEAGWMGYGSPYAGTSGIYRKDSAPLQALVVLRQGAENRLQKLSATDAFRAIYPELTIHRWDKQFTAEAVDLCLALLSQVPVYLLECLPDAEAVQLLKKGLKL